MSSSAGPSRVRRPRRSSEATSNGNTASSTGMADGARTGVSREIFVSDDCEVMALYLGSERANRKGAKCRPCERRDDDSIFTEPLRHGLKTPRQNTLLRVQAILGLVEHHRLRAVDHLVGDLVAAMRRQAMHEQCVRFRQRHQLGIDLVHLL